MPRWPAGWRRSLGCLDDPAESERAFDGLVAWRNAFGACRLARSGRR